MVEALLHQMFNDCTTRCASLTGEFNLGSPNNPLLTQTLRSTFFINRQTRGLSMPFHYSFLFLVSLTVTLDSFRSPPL